MPPGADDRNYPVSKEPVDYLKPREEEQIEGRLNMNDYTVKRLALVLAIQAEIEGMKIFNEERMRNGHTPGYDENSFYDKAEELRIIASKHDEPL